MKRDIKKIVDFTNWLEKYIIKNYGKRCSERAIGCVTCEIWAILDEMKALSDYEKCLDNEINHK